MDDSQLRRWFFVYFFGVVSVIYLFTGHPKVMLVGLFLVPLLSLALPTFMNLFSSIYTSLIYGPDYSEPSYEGQFYADDMDKAKRLVREGKWREAATAYRSIVREAPEKLEPRFYLAQSYQRAGYLGLAISEYKKIVDSKDGIGPSHTFVLESARIVEELKELPRKERIIQDRNGVLRPDQYPS